MSGAKQSARPPLRLGGKGPPTVTHKNHIGNDRTISDPYMPHRPILGMDLLLKAY